MSNSVETVPVLCFEFERPYGMMSSILESLPKFLCSRLYVNGNTMRADLQTLKDIVNDPTVKDYNVIKALRWDLCRRYPVFMGSFDLELSDGFLKSYCGKYAILEVHRPAIDPPLTSGYHKLACPEPLILEPEDWTWEQWGTLCKLCGLAPADTSRISINVQSIEVFVEPGFEKSDMGKNVLVPDK